MRIVFVTPVSWPALGGRERLLRDVTRALAARGHQIEVVARRAATDPPGRLQRHLGGGALFAPFTDGSVRVEPLALPPGRAAALLPLAAAQGRAGARATEAAAGRMSAWYAKVVGPLLTPYAARADVIHAWSGGYHAAAAQVAAARAGVPVVLTPHLHPGQWGETPDAVRSYLAADAVTPYLRPEAERLVELGVAAERVRPIPACSPGVERDDAAAAALRARHGLAADAPVVLFLGARRAHKGHDVLRAAAPLVRAAGRPEAAFVFVGPGAPVGGEGVIDAGEVDDAERAAWLSAADVLCLPSRFESFGLVVLEAWSAGVPVVAGDAPALRALVGEAGGGLTAARTPEAVAAAVGELLGDPARAMGLGDEGRRWWRAHATPAAVAEAHEELYAQLAGPEAVRGHDPGRG